MGDERADLIPVGRTRGLLRGGAHNKGRKIPKTIEKELERELVRQQVIAAREKMVRAQIEHACGISYIVLRHEDGTYTRATDEVMLDAALKAGAAQFEIFTQAPNVQAFTDLMNRALDKPAEQVRVTGADDGPVELSFRWLVPDKKP